LVAFGLVIELCPGKDRKGKDVNVVGYHGKGEIQTLQKSLQGVLRQTIDQIKAIGNLLIVEEQDIVVEFLGLEGAVDLLQHRLMDALQANLQGTVELGEEVGQLFIQVFCPNFKGIMNFRSRFDDGSQVLLGNLLVMVEGGVQDHDFRNARGVEQCQLLLYPFGRKAPDACGSPGFKAEGTAVGAAPGQLPQGTSVLVQVYQLTQIRGGKLLQYRNPTVEDPFTPGKAVIQQGLEQGNGGAFALAGDDVVDLWKGQKVFWQGRGLWPAHNDGAVGMGLFDGANQGDAFL